MKWMIPLFLLAACQHDLLLVDEAHWGLAARISAAGTPLALQAGASRTLVTTLPPEGGTSRCDPGSLGSVAVLSEGRLDWNDASGLRHVIATGAAAELLAASGRTQPLQGVGR